VLRHIVLIRFVDTATGEQRRTILDGLARLPEAIPEIRSYVFGLDAGLSEGNADLAVVADFDDEAAYRTYATHPVHVALMTEHIRPITASRVAVQHLT